MTAPFGEFPSPYDTVLVESLTNKEKQAVALIEQALNLIVEDWPEDYNILDSQQLRAKVLDLQRFILANAAARTYPDLFRVLGA